MSKENKNNPKNKVGASPPKQTKHSSKTFVFGTKEQYKESVKCPREMVCKVVPEVKIGSGRMGFEDQIPTHAMSQDRLDNQTAIPNHQENNSIAMNAGYAQDFLNMQYDHAQGPALFIGYPSPFQGTNVHQVTFGPPPGLENINRPAHGAQLNQDAQSKTAVSQESDAMLSGITGLTSRTSIPALMGKRLITGPPPGLEGACQVYQATHKQSNGSTQGTVPSHPMNVQENQGVFDNNQKAPSGQAVIQNPNVPSFPTPAASPEGPLNNVAPNIPQEMNFSMNGQQTQKQGMNMNAFVRSLVLVDMPISLYQKVLENRAFPVPLVVVGVNQWNDVCDERQKIYPQNKNEVPIVINQPVPTVNGNHSENRIAAKNATEQAIAETKQSETQQVPVQKEAAPATPSPKIQRKQSNSQPKQVVPPKSNTPGPVEKRKANQNNEKVQKTSTAGESRSSQSMKKVASTSSASIPVQKRTETSQKSATMEKPSTVGESSRPIKTSQPALSAPESAKRAESSQNRARIEKTTSGKSSSSSSMEKETTTSTASIPVQKRAETNQNSATIKKPSTTESSGPMKKNQPISIVQETAKRGESIQKSSSVQKSSSAEESSRPMKRNEPVPNAPTGRNSGAVEKIAGDPSPKCPMKKEAPNSSTSNTVQKTATNEKSSTAKESRCLMKRNEHGSISPTGRNSGAVEKRATAEESSSLMRKKPSTSSASNSDQKRVESIQKSSIIEKPSTTEESNRPMKKEASSSSASIPVQKRAETHQNSQKRCYAKVASAAIVGQMSSRGPMMETKPATSTSHPNQKRDQTVQENGNSSTVAKLGSTCATEKNEPVSVSNASTASNVSVSPIQGQPQSDAQVIVPSVNKQLNIKKAAQKSEWIQVSKKKAHNFASSSSTVSKDSSIEKKEKLVVKLGSDQPKSSSERSSSASETASNSELPKPIENDSNPIVNLSKDSSECEEEAVVAKVVEESDLKEKKEEKRQEVAPKPKEPKKTKAQKKKEKRDQKKEELAEIDKMAAELNAQDQKRKAIELNESLQNKIDVQLNYMFGEIKQHLKPFAIIIIFYLLAQSKTRLKAFAFHFLGACVAFYKDDPTNEAMKIHQFWAERPLKAERGILQRKMIQNFLEETMKECKDSTDEEEKKIIYYFSLIGKTDHGILNQDIMYIISIQCDFATRKKIVLSYIKMIEWIAEKRRTCETLDQHLVFDDCHYLILNEKIGEKAAAHFIKYIERCFKFRFLMEQNIDLLNLKGSEKEMFEWSQNCKEDDWDHSNTTTFLKKVLTDFKRMENLDKKRELIKMANFLLEIQSFVIDIDVRSIHKHRKGHGFKKNWNYLFELWFGETGT